MHVCTTSFDVRYAETDQMGVVYHANYLIWFELGRTAFTKSIGLDYLEMEEAGIVSPVINVRASFKKPVRYGDEVVVKTWIETYDGLRVTYGYEVRSAAQVCVTGTTVHVCVRKVDFRPISIRRQLPEWDEVYERVKRR